MNQIYQFESERLGFRFWNKGYATEGAKKCLEVGFEQLKLDNVYSFTAKLNRPSTKMSCFI